MTYSIATETREPSDGSRSPTEPATETRRASAGRPRPAPRPPRGAAAIPPPRKTELHRVAAPSRPLPTHEQIARRAYEIWIQSGCEAGRDSENWAQAERELIAGRGLSEISAQQG
jgi:hypothetical protein